MAKALVAQTQIFVNYAMIWWTLLSISYLNALNWLTTIYREELLSKLENNIADFKWKITLMNRVENPEETAKLFVKLVKWIDEEYYRLVPEIHL